MTKTLQFVLFICALILVPRLALSADTIMVFAAASLTDSLQQMAADYEKQGGAKIVFNFAASSLLERQIEEGAAADIFFSADEARMDWLQQRGLVLEGTRKSRLSNVLVVVVSVDSGLQVKSAADLIGQKIQRLALADPHTVPAGIYAREYFEKKQLWTSLERKVIPTDNVRAALSAVAAGNADAGVVYKTDAAISTKVRIAYEVPRSEGPPISYPIAMLKDAPHPQSAKAFLTYLCSAPADRVFQKFGFIILN